MSTDLNFARKLSDEDRQKQLLALQSTSPDDSKYKKAALTPYLSDEAEWNACALVQLKLLETRKEFGQAAEENVREVELAMDKIDPLNMALIEAAPPEQGGTRHDQLAVIEEIGRHVSPETKALLHPGTTSYDILDTARAYLLRNAWSKVIRPAVAESLEKLCDISERSMNLLQVGRTHLQDTSPITFGGMIANYAARFAERTERADDSFSRLKGKVSGIVGTGASVAMVVGPEKQQEFEQIVLKKLKLEPDYTASQIVQKETLADVGHSLTTLMYVLRDFANDIRMMYSSAIGEVTSRTNAARLGGSSADATKNNPIGWENMRGKAVVVQSGMPILYDMIVTDFQRDLSGSVEARYQPRAMMVQTYEAFQRLNKSLDQLSINEETLAANLEPVRKNPSEAMVAILRGSRFQHPNIGNAHDFVKHIGKRSKKEKRPLLDIAQEYKTFNEIIGTLPEYQKEILNGKLENYIGNSIQRAEHNRSYAQGIAKTTLPF